MIGGRAFDSAHAAGALVVGAVIVLALLRKGFGDLSVTVGD